MANALDMFRAQLEAAEKAQARFAETARRSYPGARPA